MTDYLLDRVLEQFSTELGQILPDNDNYPPELPAFCDPSTYEFEERDTDNGVVRLDITPEQGDEARD